MCGGRHFSVVVDSSHSWRISTPFQSFGKGAPAGERVTSKVVVPGWTAATEPGANWKSTVKRASLHNAGYIRKLGLTKNARVFVTRRGGVIPKIEFVAEPGHGEIEIPTSCPSCGRAVPGVSVEIWAEDGRRRLPPGEQGRVMIRGVTLMREYWKQPEATAQAITPDGWFDSGDLCASASLSPTRRSP